MEQDITGEEQAKLETPSSRIAAILESYKKHGIIALDDTAEMVGKTSVLFMCSPNTEDTESGEANDRAETMIRNLNRRKGH